MVSCVERKETLFYFFGSLKAFPSAFSTYIPSSIAFSALYALYSALDCDELYLEDEVFDEVEEEEEAATLTK